MPQKIYPRSKDRETIYLKNVISNPNIIVGDYTIYNDFVKEPREFEKNNVLYQYPINQDKLIIGKFCSIACGAKFIFNSVNHSLSSLSTYPFPIFFEEWNLDVKDIKNAWDNKGDIVIGNDVWIGYEAAEKIVKIVDTVEPEPALVEKYEKRYQQFKQIYPTCKELFKKIH